MKYVRQLHREPLMRDLWAQHLVATQKQVLVVSGVCLGWVKSLVQSYTRLAGTSDSALT